MKDTKIIVTDKDFQRYSGPLAVVLMDEDKNITSFLDKQLRHPISWLFYLTI